jgi:hypothetical protein
MNEEQKQNDQQNAGKVAKQFDENMNKLIAILGGKDLLKTPKLGADDLTEAVKELAKEEKEKRVKLFKEKAAAIIQRKMEFDKEVAAKEKEFQNTVNAKKKEFNEEIKGVFSMIKEIENIEKSYYETLKGMAKPDEGSQTTVQEEGQKPE